MASQDGANDGPAQTPQAPPEFFAFNYPPEYTLLDPSLIPLTHPAAASAFAKRTDTYDLQDYCPPAPDPEPDETLDEEPLYVNAKQYHRILKRRTARARLEEVHRLSKERKVSLYILCYFNP